MKAVSLLLTLAGALAAGQPGTRPRADANEYPAHASTGPVAIGARLLTPGQVQDTFSTDLNRGYVVVEVAVYPKDGGSLDLGPGDFLLRIGGTETDARPATPRAVAAALRKASSKDRDVALYPSAGVGYESGPRVYDPATGGTRGGGWNTGAGVGVGVGGQHPASTDADRKTMEMELSDQELPEKVITAPVAGYLYFPLVTKKKNTVYELEYQGQAIRLVIPFEPARTK
jgi:hypothetical protein